MLAVERRDGRQVEFDSKEIVVATEKATNSSTGIYEENLAEKIAKEIEGYARTIGKVPNITDIKDQVYYRLIRYNNPATARAHENYKAVQKYKRETNTTDESIIGLLKESNKDLLEENSNKNAVIASTQRDLIVGEVSKDIARRKLIPQDLLQAHDEGAIHLHDMDYIIRPMFNHYLVNMKDMLNKGTVVNGKLIESPRPFQIACNVMTQIIAQIASNQYGGQSIDIRCLSKYLRKSYEKNLNLCTETLGDIDMTEKMADKMTQKDLGSRIQTIQYQINTLMTSNGQAPFVTLSMFIEDHDEYKDKTAEIIEEILKQRIQGIKNEAEVHVTSTLPKLIYVLDENDIHKDNEFYHLTSLAIRCTAKRMYPDYISAKEMRENYEGNVFSPMGCRAFLSPWQDEHGSCQSEGRFNIGVVTINLPQIGILTDGDEDKFFEVLDKRLEMCKRAGALRYDSLKDVTNDSSSVHWQHGAITRLQPHTPIKDLLIGGYAIVTLGYIGIYEATLLTIDESHTTPKGKEFTMEIMGIMNEKTKRWKKKTNLGLALYGTPAESLTRRFNSIDRERFGVIENAIDKGYYTNSFHVGVRENIFAPEKSLFESKFRDKSSGGCISYVEISSMSKDLKALETLVKYIYDNIQYAEFNTKSDYYQNCGFDGEIIINEDDDWQCPQCGNKDHATMNVVRRTCGYLGENFWNEGRTKEIKDKVLHI